MSEITGYGPTTGQHYGQPGYQNYRQPAQYGPPPLVVPGVDAKYGKRVETRLSRIEAAVWATLGVATVGTLVVLYFLYKFIELANALHNAFSANGS